MLKRVLGLLVCVLIVLAFAGCMCDGGPRTIDGGPRIVTELNQPFENSDIRVTVTNISAIKTNHEIAVSADFVVENLSARSMPLGRFNVSTVVDGVAVSGTNNSANIPPGRRAEISLTRRIPANSNIIEFYFQDPLLSSVGNLVIFVFDIPLVEE